LFYCSFILLLLQLCEPLNTTEMYTTVRRPCSDFTDMLRRHINCRIIIITCTMQSHKIVISHKKKQKDKCRLVTGTSSRDGKQNVTFFNSIIPLMSSGLRPSSELLSISDFCNISPATSTDDAITDVQIKLCNNSN